MISAKILYTALFLLPALSSGKLYTSPDQVTQSQYDFVIVGAGTAGSVLANRLTADGKTTVLVVEAGGSNDGIVTMECPFTAFTLPGTSNDWNYTTTAQTGLNGRTFGYTRGHVFGGSSSVNYMTYNRGSNDVWDNWAKITGDSSWSWSNIEQYYMKNSRLVPPADGHDTTGQVNPAAHGNGPLQLSAPGYKVVLDDYVINTSKSLGGKYAYNEDVNAGSPLGTGYMQSSIGNGTRDSASTAYLEPAMSRSNLDVLMHTQATRLIASSGVKKPVFRTLEVAQSASGQRYTFQAKNEVILSAGSIGTPQILLLSGIGNKTTLSSAGISSVVDLPDVGQHLTDHPFLPNYYTINTTETVDDISRNTTAFQDGLAQWEATHQGRYVIPSGNTQTFLKLPTNSSAYQTYGDPSSGPGAANVHILYEDGFVSFGPIPMPSTGDYMTAFTAVFSPLSRGSVTLASSNPFDKPLINPNVLGHDYDIQAMVQAIRDVQTFVASSAWNGLIVGPYGPYANATTDAELATYARNNAVTVNHPVSTAKMSATNATDGVVDPTLLVKGADGLRVVDASVFPVIPEAHTMAAVYILAERAADIILNAYGL